MGKTKQQKDIILFVGTLSETIVAALKRYQQETKKRFRIGLLYDKAVHVKERSLPNGIDIHIPCDTTSEESIKEALEPYQKALLCVTARGESNLLFFKRVQPYIKYAKTPDADALRVATNKLLIRKRLAATHPEMNPRYAVVSDSEKKTLDEVEKKVGFPLVVKPVGLTTGGMFMHVCYYREELEKNLPLVLSQMTAYHSEIEKNSPPKILIEQCIEGETYSFDAYITPRGKIYLCPLIEIKTGRSVGYDDFFSYLQITPSSLSPSEIKTANMLATDALRSIGLTASSAHIELMRSEEGWKVASMGPKVSGWRNDLYTLSYGIDHTVNDILVRIPEKPIFSKKIKSQSAVLKFYSKKEGKLERLTGIKKVQDLSSFHRMRIRKKNGDMCKFAKHGHKPVFDVTLTNKNRSKLLADIRRIEQTVKIETK